ncbi:MULTISPECIES: TIGR03621 family F420-dependent LLM class oxidoreductase [Streptomyces]|uniref:TIGR03621 family F420-dependent LLM class oxidoreductase n=1 Tax=Streptomyces solicathayae TaxID=3081768 RepID=A0ABZ0M1U7_9ACTN|nr:TIGR03621 family F420-dependent LLM class oxidoreductase [Streptomyces sp. HUAS YS2]WOX25692.1 TIGR03621 family F420-dependent LLM class oxidoreductase [Streptomyces sp. HUAS YS2]
MSSSALPFRFGVNMLTHGTGEEWRARCRRAEELGYDVILVADHLGMPAPFPALVAAAAVTSRPRLGTFVLNAGFWNPALLAREVTTTQALTDGRLEVGIGTGYVREEHDTAGLDFLPPGRRVDHLERTVEELDRHLDGQAPPLLIGGNGDRVLRLAARRAGVAAFAGGRTEGGRVHVLSAEEMDERVAAYERFEAESGREAPAERNLLIQRVTVTDDRAAAVAEFLPVVPYLTEKQVLDLPLLAYGTAREIADQLRERRERYGFSYYTVLDNAMEEFGPVLAELRKD